MNLTRCVAGALLVQSAPSVFMGFTAWGMLSAVLGCGMWAFAFIAEANEGPEQMKVLEAQHAAMSARLKAAERDVAMALSTASSAAEHAGQLEQKIASVSSRVGMKSFGG